MGKVLTKISPKRLECLFRVESIANQRCIGLDIDENIDIYYGKTDQWYPAGSLSYVLFVRVPPHFVLDYL